MTKNRKRILEIVKGRLDHPNVKQIFEEFRIKYGDVAFATIYNGVNFLRETKKLTEILRDEDGSRFDAITKSHDHFICNKCKKIIDLYRDNIKVPSCPTLKETEYLIESHTTYYYGICKNCQKEQDGSNSKV